MCGRGRAGVGGACGYVGGALSGWAGLAGVWKGPCGDGRGLWVCGRGLAGMGGALRRWAVLAGVWAGQCGDGRDRAEMGGACTSSWRGVNLRSQRRVRRIGRSPRSGEASPSPSAPGSARTRPRALSACGPGLAVPQLLRRALFADVRGGRGEAPGEPSRLPGPHQGHHLPLTASACASSSRTAHTAGGGSSPSSLLTSRRSRRDTNTTAGFAPGPVGRARARAHVRTPACTRALAHAPTGRLSLQQPPWHEGRAPPWEAGRFCGRSADTPPPPAVHGRCAHALWHLQRKGTKAPDGILRGREAGGPARDTGQTGRATWPKPHGPGRLAAWPGCCPNPGPGPLASHARFLPAALAVTPVLTKALRDRERAVLATEDTQCSALFLGLRGGGQFCFF